MSIFNLEAILSLNSEQYEDGLNKAEGKANSFGSKLAAVLGTAAKVGAAAVGVASTAVGAIVKQSTDAYANYEQLAGGVETLFGKTETVLTNAENAYKTAGMSANDYMQTVISMAGALNKATGDTEESAKLADIAITDMSDNVNKMGTSMEMVQNAYTGFTRGNFTMLDNLALGYAGTKEGMEELLKRAQEISGIEYDISSYADIVNAIHVVQTEMGITGTTAKEAAGTISGSAGSMRAAWQNLIAGLSKDSADLDGLIDAVVSSAMAMLENTLPIVEKAIGGVGKLVSKAAPIIVEELPKLIDRVLPSLLDSATQLIDAVAETLPDAIVKIVDALLKNLPKIATVGVQAVAKLAGGIAKALPTLIPVAVDAIITIADGLTDNISLLIDAAIDLMLGLAKGLEKALPKLVKEVPRIVKALANAFVKAWPEITKALTELATSDAGAIVTAFASVKGGIKALKMGGIFDAVKKGVKNSIKSFKDWAWFLSNPLFASVTATVGGLAALFIGLREVREKALQGEYGLTDAQKDAMEAAHNFAESYRETETVRQESFASIDAEYKYLDGLKNEFNDLVGSNDEVKKGYEERAEFIKGEFAKVLGLERDEVDKLLNKNGQLGKSIDLLVEKKRAQAIFDASEDAYKESIQKRDEALKNLVDTQAAAQDAQKKLDKYWADHLKEYENAGNMGGYNNSVTDYTKSRIEAEARKLEAGVENAKQAAKEAEEAFVGYNSQLKNYEQLAGALNTDNIERITEMADNLKANLITAETGTRATLEAQLQAHEENLANIERMAKNSAYNISKETVAEYRDMRDRAKAELDRFEKDFAENQDAVQAKAKETTEAVGKESKEAVRKVKAPWEGTKQHFEGVWSGIKGAFAGVADWFGTTFGTARQKTESAFGGITDFFSDLWNGITGVFSNAEEVFAGIGNNVQIGFKRGVNQGALPTWMGTQMTDITLGAQRALGERSPSKVFEQIGRYIDEGLVQGIDGGLSMVENAVDELAETTYDRDFFDGQEVQVSTTAQGFDMGDSGRYVEVPRYTAPQYLNLTVELGGQKVKSVIYEMVQEESSRVGLKLVKGAMA